MATTAELLVEAETAYHKLMTGTLARVFVDQNGERVEYTATNAARLSAYIQSLKDLIAGDTSNRAPMRPFFL